MTASRLTRRAGYSILVAFAILLLAVFVGLDAMAPGGRRLAKIEGFDTVNYFGISHSLLFDHDFNLTNEFTHIAPMSRLWSAVQPNTGLPGSVWGYGYSVLEMPFLAVGTLLDVVQGSPADGYSPSAIYVYCLGNVVMTGLGLLALFALLCRVGTERGISEERVTGYSLLVTFAVFFGTNVGYYAFPQLAHAATFLFASLFLAYWWKMRTSNKARVWLLLGLIGGFLSICRWQDIIFLGGPGLFDLLSGAPWKNPWPWLRSRLFYIAGAGICWIPQVIEWKVIYGKYLTMPQGAGFIVFPPAFILEVLFSSRNGWFLWTPFALIGVLGLLYGALRFTREFIPWIVVLALEVIVIGSMPTWHGYDSFSSRYLLTNSPLVGLGLFTLLCSLSPLLRRTLVAAVAACCIFTMLFAVQYRLNLIPNNETLTFSEIFTDKLRLLQVRRRKSAANTARWLLSKGHAFDAVILLEQAATLGDDRDVLSAMGSAYRAEGDVKLALAAEIKAQEFRDSRWR
jgi:hypothetical protein